MHKDNSPAAAPVRPDGKSLPRTSARAPPVHEATGGHALGRTGAAEGLEPLMHGNMAIFP